MALSLAAWTAAAAALAPLLAGPPEAPQLAAGWRISTLPRQTKPVTQFTAERSEGRASLRIDADESYGNLLQELPALPAAGHLRWSWRLQQGNPASDLHSRSGDDTPAKVCIGFELPTEQLPFGDRMFLRLARASAGEPVPAATLCWVWGRIEPRGSLIDNPFTRRVRYIVLRNAADNAGTWFDENRDIAADFRRAFGDEAGPTLPPMSALLVGGDADNTHRHTVAHLADLRLEAAP